MKRERNLDYLLRPEEAAQILGVSRATLYLLVRTGRIPSLKIGRSRRIPSEELKRWLKEQTKQAQLLLPFPEEKA